ncbi:glycoside hydrolase domain-containing protein [Amycolatopsis sp. Poz14]|uniref:glycoside hydrolase domain-containing protein n=1 Tax=Amycolatopsis sp. Poz14 TaxID=1447705 RepID=UPI001EE903DA|nr:glycoside hydrolase domain-containing protein [Amycolatopsis sp. Poz14]MCG3757365.1 DUF1906 domain-containing protein [Amycolatopsis sp. Poz14]
MARWADYSAGRPSGAALRRAGFSGVVRYIGLGREGKQLTAAEYRDLVGEFGAANVLLVAEAGTADAWGTDTDDDYARGVAYGRIALADARAAGVPDWAGLACAADAHAQAFQLDDVVRYASGFRDVVGQGRCGVYGFSETLGVVHDAGIGCWYWLCGSELAQNDPRRAWVNLWQRNRPPTVINVAGVPCDINEIYRVPQTQEVPDMDATQARQLAELHSWLSPLSLEIGPKNADGIAPRSNAKPLNDMLANVYGMLFFPSNYIAAPDGSPMPSILSMVAKAAYGSGVDQTAITAAVEKAVGAGLDDFRAQLRADVVAVLGEDNAEQADEIVAAIAARLGAKPAVAQ